MVTLSDCPCVRGVLVFLKAKRPPQITLSIRLQFNSRLAEPVFPKLVVMLCYGFMKVLGSKNPLIREGGHQLSKGQKY